MKEMILGLLTMIRPWFTLNPSDRARVYGWVGETLREAAGLIFVFIAAERYLDGIA